MAVTLSLCAVARAAGAQATTDGAKTRDSTIRWIAATLPELGSYKMVIPTERDRGPEHPRNNREGWIVNAESDGCNLSYDVMTRVGDGAPGKNHVVLDLSHLDPAAARLRNIDDHQQGYTPKVYSLTISSRYVASTNDSDLGVRVMKAFQRAVSLCRAR